MSFNFFKPKTIDIFAPCDGELVLQKDIPDEGFSEGHMGWGVGIKPTSEDVVAPLSGQLVVLFRTKHAYVIKDLKDGISVMLHLGINTVNIAIEKNAFTTTLAQNDNVVAKSKLCTMNLEVIKTEATSDISALLIQQENLENKTIQYHKKTGTVKQGELLMSIVPK